MLCFSSTVHFPQRPRLGEDFSFTADIDVPRRGISRIRELHTPSAPSCNLYIPNVRRVVGVYSAAVGAHPEAAPAAVHLYFDFIDIGRKDDACFRASFEGFPASSPSPNSSPDGPGSLRPRVEVFACDKSWIALSLRLTQIVRGCSYSRKCAE